MTNVDVAALAAELGPLCAGARLDKAYQPGKEQVLLRLRRKGAGKLDLLMELGRYATVTRKPPQNPDKPSMVAQILRNTLENARLSSVRQIGFDRLLRLDFERGDGRHSLVLELFGDGNLLLLDGDDRIVLPMRGEDHGARRLRKGEPYLPPPGSASPFAMDAAALATAAAASGSKDVVRFLAVALGFGPLWAEELCLRAAVDKKTPLPGMDGAAWAKVHAALSSLGRDIARNDLAPAVVFEDGKPVDAVPFVLQRYPAPRFSHEEAPTFREALDAFFLGATGDDDGEEPDDPRRAKYDDALAKVDVQLKQMDDAIANFVAQEDADRLDGDALYASFADVQSALDALNQARKERSWAEVEAALAKGRAEGHALALRVPEVRPHSGEAVLKVQLPDGAERTVTVDLRKTVQENAEACYAAAKPWRAARPSRPPASTPSARPRCAPNGRAGTSGSNPTGGRCCRPASLPWAAAAPRRTTPSSRSTCATATATCTPTCTARPASSCAPATARRSNPPPRTCEPRASSPCAPAAPGGKAPPALRTG
jgi:predicted ribosome quality control (RQC) complex YloA/Tae2 family protein